MLHFIWFTPKIFTYFLLGGGGGALWGGPVSHPNYFFEEKFVFESFTFSVRDGGRGEIVHIYRK